MSQSSERRKRVRHVRKQRDAVWERDMVPIPEHILRFFSEVEPNTCRHVDRWERAPEHMIDPQIGCIDPGKQEKLTRTAADRRAAEFEMRRAELERDNRDIWGKRGKAAIVAQRYNKVHPREPISVRTVQRYFSGVK